MNREFPIATSPPAGWSKFLVLAAFVVALPVLVVAVALLWPSDPRFEIASGGLAVRGLSYGKAFKAADLDARHARRLSEADLPTYGPKQRTNGVGLPGYQGGHFTLEDGSKGLLFVSDWTRAVAVPTKTGETLIVSPEDPDGLLAKLKGPSTADTNVFRLAPTAGSGPWPWLVLLTIPLAVVGLLTLLARSGSKIRFELDEESLKVVGAFLYGRSIRRTLLQPGEATVIDMRSHEKFGRMLRLNGIGLPNYLAGWFRPKGGGRALLFVTDPERVVVVPTSEGYTLLLSPAEPEAFMKGLHEGA
ncbi:MAG: PH domain-containing protein [Isosphaeraceae bacterium]